MYMREIVLRTQEVCERLGISATTLWRWRKSGQFPEPNNISGSSLQGWSESTINKWIVKNFSIDEEG